MTSSAATLATGLLGLAAMGGAAAVGATVARRQRNYLPGGIAVAVHGPPDPLAHTLRQGLAGLEVGVRLDTEWQLCLTGGGPADSLEHLVVVPLAQRVALTAHGRVYGPWSEPFQLLLRLDRGVAGVAAYVALEALLTKYRERWPGPMPTSCMGLDLFTRWVDDKVTPGAVTVLLSGPGWPPIDADDRAVFVEGHVDAPCGPPSLVPLVYESLTRRLGWDPREPWRELPAEARHIVRSLVRQAHAEGRRLRFIDVPEKPAAVRRALWRELRAAGVDYHSSSHIGALARFLRGGFPGARRDRRHAAPRSRYATT
jgi:hypothetical protein